MSRVARILLWIEAAICFGPIAFVVSLGLLIFPVWTAMLLGATVGTLGWVDGAGITMWEVVRAMTLVLAGTTGLIGLIRVLFVLSSNENRPGSSRATAIMIAIGLVALVSFNLVDPPRNTASIVVYVLLPGIGSLHLLCLAGVSWVVRRTAAKQSRV